MILEDWEWRTMLRVIAEMNSNPDDRLFRLQFLRSIKRLVPHDGGSFYLGSNSAERPIVDPVGIDLPEGKLEEYESYYYQFDYCRQFYPFVKSMVFRDSDFIRLSEKQGNFWNEFYREGMHVLDCYVATVEGLLGCISIVRYAKSNNFDEHDVEIMNLLLPHLEIRLHRTGAGAATRREGRLVLPSSRMAEQYDFTSRERQVFSLLLHGKTNVEISRQLAISESTVKKHVGAILRKTGYRSRAELIAKNTVLS